MWIIIIGVILFVIDIKYKFNSGQISDGLSRDWLDDIAISWKWNTCSRAWKLKLFSKWKLLPHKVLLKNELLAFNSQTRESLMFILGVDIYIFFSRRC